MNLQTTNKENLVLIPAGKVEVGSDTGGQFEAPSKTLFVDAFLLSPTPVTNQEFSEFVHATGYVTTAEKRGFAWGFQNGEFGNFDNLSWRSYADERPRHPVVMVSWYDAKAYCDWVKMRLPLEYEWEKAARGGLGGADFPWGNQAPNGSQCNFARKPEHSGLSLPTTDVTEFAANGLGIYDMVGNVWQWCEDELNLFPKSQDCRARRGGAWNVIQPFRLRCSNRGAIEATATTPNIGFRYACNA